MRARLHTLLQFLHRRRAALSGFACGVAAPLLLASLVMVPIRGGFSDTLVQPPLAFFMDYAD